MVSSFSTGSFRARRTHLDSMVGKTQAKLAAGHHGFSEPPVVTAHGSPASDPVHLHLYLHHTFLRAAPASQAHLQWSDMGEEQGGLRRGELSMPRPAHCAALTWHAPSPACLLLCNMRTLYQRVPNVPSCSRNLTQSACSQGFCCSTCPPSL